MIHAIERCSLMMNNFSASFNQNLVERFFYNPGGDVLKLVRIKPTKKNTTFLVRRFIMCALIAGVKVVTI